MDCNCSIIWSVCNYTLVGRHGWKHQLSWLGGEGQDSGVEVRKAQGEGGWGRAKLEKEKRKKRAATFQRSVWCCASSGRVVAVGPGKEPVQVSGETTGQTPAKWQSGHGQMCGSALYTQTTRWFMDTHTHKRLQRHANTEFHSKDKYQPFGKCDTQSEINYVMLVKLFLTPLLRICIKFNSFF